MSDPEKTGLRLIKGGQTDLIPLAYHPKKNPLQSILRSRSDASQERALLRAIKNGSEAPTKIISIHVRPDPPIA